MSNEGNRLTQAEDGASAVEYGLLLTGVAALIVVIVFAFGGMVSNLFGGSCSTVKQSVQNSTATC